jgi:hypothetical protein
MEFEAVFFCHSLFTVGGDDLYPDMDIVGKIQDFQWFQDPILIYRFNSYRCHWSHLRSSIPRNINFINRERTENDQSLLGVEYWNSLTQAALQKTDDAAGYTPRYLFLLVQQDIPVIEHEAHLNDRAGGVEGDLAEGMVLAHR